MLYHNCPERRETLFSKSRHKLIQPPLYPIVKEGVVARKMLSKLKLMLNGILNLLGTVFEVTSSDDASNCFRSP